MGVEIQAAQVDVNVWATPKDHGFKAWAYDLSLGGSSSLTPTAGVLYLSKIVVRSAFLASNIHLNLAFAGTGLSNTFVGIITASGDQVAVSADASTTLETPGFKTIPVTTPVTIDQVGSFVWVALVVGGLSSAPQPRVSPVSNIAVTNVNLTAATARAASQLTGLTTIPSSITPASNNFSAGQFWCALS